MDSSLAIWVLILIAFAAANAPFLSERWLLVGPRARIAKPLFGRLLELVLLYFVVGVVGRLVEGRLGQVAPQGWEFYAVTASLFLTFAFPGFVYRYLMRRDARAPDDEV